MNNETIQLRNLSIGYQTKHSVKAVAAGINGAIRSGELTCLLGANGVGKSTLLRTLAAFQPAISGEIFVVERGKRKEERDYLKGNNQPQEYSHSTFHLPPSTINAL